MRATLLTAVLLTAVLLSGCNNSNEPNINLNSSTDPGTVTPPEGDTGQSPSGSANSDIPLDQSDQAPVDPVPAP